ncbi:MAG: SgcJ/EcaC family oxidoreductase [Gammaproteobacteria bacterium]|nr:SgcJ/EcaC family oxidoreductase [Gammaproteobacteria bacterium]
MKLIERAMVLLIAGTLVGIGQGSAQAASDVRATIVASIEQWTTAFNEADAAGVAAMYTQEGQLLPPGGPTVTGREAIQAFWQGVMDSGIAKAELEATEIEGSGALVYEVGVYRLFGTDGQLAGEGKYIVVWKQSDGQWRLHRDIWNGNS